jgi:hypothetical protein
MAERSFNSSSTNSASPLASPICGEWEAHLADVLDGLLKPADEAVFHAHRSCCPACAALYEEARRGREWLEFLLPEPEPPQGLLERILARTGPELENLGPENLRLENSKPESPGLASPGLENSGPEGSGRAADRGLAAGGGNALPKPPVFVSALAPASVPASIPAWRRPSFLARTLRFTEPRLMMTAAMAFFSIAMTLNLTGLRLSSLPLSELRPSAAGSLPGAARAFLERRLTTASTPIIRFYDHSRLVYEVQATVRELRRTTEAGGDGQSEEKRRGPQEHFRNCCRPKPHTQVAFSSRKSHIQCTQKDYINSENAPELTPGESKEASLRKGQEDPLESANKLASGPAFALNFPPAAEPTGNNSNFSFDFRKIAARFNGQPALSGGAARQERERSTVWTAQITRA